MMKAPIDPAGQGGQAVEQLDLGDVVAHLATTMTTIIGPQTRVDVEIAPGLPAIYGVRAELEELVLDLVANASAAMRPFGGHIAVDVRAGAFGVVLEVTDEGPRKDPRVFGYATGAASQRQRIGLALVRDVARRHGAGVTVTSKPSSGTTVAVMFPALGTRGAPS